MTFNPSEELRDFLNSMDICSFRLVDGTYIIAESVHSDEDNNIIHLVSPVQLNHDTLKEKCYLSTWLDTEEDEVVQLAGDKIVGFTETPFHLRINYHRYLILQKLKDTLTDDEIDDVMQEMINPQVDNLDDTEGEEWKIDKGINDTQGLKEDKGYQSTSDIHIEWRKKYRDNK